MEPKYWFFIPFGLVAAIAGGVLWAAACCYCSVEEEEEIPLLIL